ncbi:putative F420-dependent oxidoreductase, MSMEG_2516 family [Frankia canadensis]|uniref:Putative F420-dependent oxidoreductase, MSMEG_2516 family n=1 Tax=Frankia canadensis TaxID=1836972 RepID=A0A2I2KXK0_9ACTN|nr:TIGR03621 family F420-dependent LLM class oxidoreductase [Frankia canadensis]SNQ50386.1 putative F420-dependent oxidoreductase, MSMEG_2516 family [Frankia canadensis]SOU57676.1 putative F420-dependent oxidoreductase, MSMEG_2516 family [Frankia canadensis]
MPVGGAVRPFRFGVNMLAVSEPASWSATARRAEDLGYDVLLVPDHLGLPAPFPTLVAAAAVTSLRVGTFVLNAAFHNPALLARDVATTDTLVGGRLELGIGTGYVADEFAVAGIPFGSPGERVAHLERMIDALAAHLADPAGLPRPVQRSVPLLIGGNGDRMLSLAARRADIVAFTGAAADPTATGGMRLLSADAFAERIAFYEQAAGPRGVDIERNLLLQVVAPGDSRESALAEYGAAHGRDGRGERATAPTLLAGSPDEMVAQVHDLRDRFGITYLTVLQPSMETFAPVIDAVRHG